MVYTNIINEKTLPKPLSDMEFDCYYKQFREGNIEARDILIYHNIRLVYWYIKLHIRCEISEFDDVLSLGMEALVESIYNFDSDRGIEFSTYVTACVRNKILKYFRSEEKYKKVMSLDTPISDSDDADSFLDMLMDDSLDLEQDIVEKDLISFRSRIINAELETLNEVDRMIVKMYFGFCDGKLYSQREIALALGFSQSQISKRLSRTIKGLKNKIELIEQENIDIEMRLVKRAA